MAIMGVVVAVLIFLGVAVQAEDDNLYGERVTHSSCYITEKTANRVKSMVYTVTSSCGTFKTLEFVFNTVEPGNTYDLMTTKGNWASAAFLVKGDLVDTEKK